MTPTLTWTQRFKCKIKYDKSEKSDDNELRVLVTLRHEEEIDGSKQRAITGKKKMSIDK